MKLLSRHLYSTSIRFAKYLSSVSIQPVTTNLLTKMPGLALTDVVERLNTFAPLDLAENWDNVGLLLEPHTPKNVKKILLTNDLTEVVMQEAVEKHTDLIISYHPPIFTGMKQVVQGNWKQRLVACCLENRIAVYSPHTAWDSVENGVNDWLAKSMPFFSSRPITAHVSNPPTVGAGRLLDITQTFTLREAIARVKSHVGVDHVHVALGVASTLDETLVKTVAICAGSGSGVLRNTDANLYITGEMSHHDLLDAMHRNITVILCNHSNSERGYLSEFKQRFAPLLPASVEILVSQTDADPLKTY